MEFNKASPNTTEQNTISSKKAGKMKFNGKNHQDVSLNVKEGEVAEDDEDINPWMKGIEGKRSNNIPKKDSRYISAKKAQRKGLIDVEGASNILDAKTRDGEKMTTLQGRERDHAESEKDGELEKKITLLTQEELV